ncbi:hypothetical protein ABNF97_22930 [Plantactinospora sp. B6F1]|uniref:hypothetical protein n=1 Tax=Plantactinospora sp. B6F1 TaxID=3158971 RepID=UPI0013EF0127
MASVDQVRAALAEAAAQSNTRTSRFPAEQGNRRRIKPATTFLGCAEATRQYIGVVG